VLQAVQDVRTSSSSYVVKRHYPEQPPPKRPDEISYNNYYPPSAVLTHHPADGANKTAVEFVTDCGFAGERCPVDVAKLLETAYGEHPIILAASVHELPPGASTTLTYTYGIRPSEDAPTPYSPPLIPKVSTCDWGVDTIVEAAGSYLSEAQTKAISREASFKFTQLQSWALYREYYNRTAIPQGCMYLYTQGHDSAPRDLHQVSISFLFFGLFLVRTYSY
jgi:hypothetical protein